MRSLEYASTKYSAYLRGCLPMAGGKLAPKLTRRQEYAEATRKAILDAARRLFCEQGFFSTKVDDIAASARVSAATVYAVSGGKHELLQTLIEIGTTAPITTAAVAHVATIESPKAVIDGLARSCRLVREEFGSGASADDSPKSTAEALR